MNTNIGLKIKKLRTLKGITQKELAEKIGVTRLTINKYEKSCFAPSHKYLSLICKELNCTEEYLYGIEDDSIDKQLINNKIFEYLIESALKVRYEDLDDENLKLFMLYVNGYFKSLDSIYNDINDEYPETQFTEEEKIQLKKEKQEERKRDLSSFKKLEELYSTDCKIENIVITKK